MRYKKPSSVIFILIVFLMLLSLTACSKKNKLSGVWDSEWEVQELVWYGSDGRKTDTDYYWDSTRFVFDSDNFTYIYKIKQYGNLESVFYDYETIESGNDKDGDYKICQKVRVGTFSLTDDEIELLFSDNNEIFVQSFSRTENTIKVDGIRYTKK